MSVLWRLFAALVTLCAELVSAQNGPTVWTTLPFNPSALPLAVRNPYLNTWLAQGNNPGPLNGPLWSEFWSTAVSTFGYLLWELLEGSS